MKKPVKNYNLKNLNVLIVEKLPAMRNMFVGVLRQLGVKDIRDAPTPDKGFEMLRDKPADLIFTDWGPAFDGIKLLFKIRKDPDSPDPYVAVIMVTACTELQEVITARDAGITEFLAKPVSVESLYERICSVIESHRVFIRSRDFVGPDRRRRSLDYGGSEQRTHSNISGFDRRVRGRSFSGQNRRLMLYGRETAVAPK